MIVANARADLGLRSRTSFDFDWRFRRGEAARAQQVGFDDTAWRKLNVPHDWSIEGPFVQSNATSQRGGFAPCGVAWYRKTFEFRKAWTGRKVFIEFDGIFCNGQVWINGHSLGSRPIGYVGYQYDLTEHLKPGKNVLAVKCDTTLQPNSRWYTGAGIYRHVWLTVTDPVHVGHWGTFVTTPKIAADAATVAVRTTVANARAEAAKIVLVSIVIDADDADGKNLATAEATVDLPAGGRKDVEQTLSVPKPKLWSPSSPNLYLLRTLVTTVDGRGVDDYETTFGIRTIRFDVDKGFFLNGKPLKFKGVCNHHDAGPVGAAVPDKLLEARLKQLKAMGCNAVRTAHNPFAPEFYAMCDRLGLMVMDEAFDGWRVNKAPKDYGLYFDKWWQRDLVDFIRRDRNHPCIMLWSIGNEVRGKTDELTRKIQDVVHRTDPTRAVTCGRGEHGVVDIQGYNGDGGKPGTLERLAKTRTKPIILTEVPHTFQTRGFYRTRTWWRDPKTKRHPRNPVADLTDKEVFTGDNVKTSGHRITYNSSYDNSGVRICARLSWQRTRDFPFVAGEFRWTGFDYLGESFGWPLKSANFGIIDLVGFPKDHYYFYQSQWTREPMVHLLPHWTHPGKEGVKIPVWAYTNCDDVELFLNGTSLGRQAVGDKMHLSWLVPYAPGTLKAVGRRGDEIVASKTVVTAGAPAGLKLTCDNAEIAPDARDIAQVAVAVVDTDGHFAPLASSRVAFHVNGPARLIGVGNGDPADLENYTNTHRRAFYGLCKALVQSTQAKGPAELVAGAILGEEYFQDTGVVAIDVKSVALRGRPDNGAITITYTTDGSAPTDASTPYKAPISLKATTTVKANIFQSGKSVMVLGATFTKGRRPVVADHSPPRGPQTPFSKRPKANVLVGAWNELTPKRSFIFTADGVVKKVEKGKQRPVARWWYEFPADPLENPKNTGRGEMTWGNSGHVTKLRLKTIDGRELIIGSGAKTRRFVKAR